MVKKILIGTLLGLVIAILTVLVILLWYAPRYVLDTSAVSVSEEESDEITVMSANVRFYNPLDFLKKSWFYRASLITADVNEVKPDIVGFQEVTFLHYDHLKDTMPDYDSEIAYRDDFVLSEGCPIFYRRDKFEKTESGSFWLSETPEVMSKDWGSSHYRICVYVILKEIATGKEFVVFNTHLDNVSDEARINGIKVILDKISAFGDLPSFLMGDLNAEPGSVTIDSALEHFDDTARLAGVTDDAPTFHGWGNKSKEERIDYILSSKGDAEVSEYKIHNNLHGDAYSSDHYSIYVKVKLK